MKNVLIVALLLMLPAVSYADKYEDVQTGLREVQIAYSQLDVKAAQAATVASIQQALTHIAKDLGDLQKEAKANEDKVNACEKPKDKK